MSIKKLSIKKPRKRSSGEPYKEAEFAAFLAILEDEGATAHWREIAAIIGVDEDTVTRWRRLPRAQNIISKGIVKSLKQMELYGKRDWRMWREKLKMLGLIEVQQQKLTGPDGGSIQFNVISDGYNNTRHIENEATPDRSLEGPDEIQGTDLAPQGS